MTRRSGCGRYLRVGAVSHRSPIRFLALVADATDAELTSRPYLLHTREAVTNPSAHSIRLAKSHTPRPEGAQESSPGCNPGAQTRKPAESDAPPTPHSEPRPQGCADRSHTTNSPHGTPQSPEGAQDCPSRGIPGWRLIDRMLREVVVQRRPPLRGTRHIRSIDLPMPEKTHPWPHFQRGVRCGQRLLERFRQAISQRRVQPLAIVIVVDELAVQTDVGDVSHPELVEAGQRESAARFKHTG